MVELDIKATYLLMSYSETLAKGLSMTSKRLPPGQREARGVLILQIAGIPRVDVKTWRLEVLGEVEKPETFSIDDLNAIPGVVSVADFHCVEGWSILDNKWEGILLRTIAYIVKPKPNAKYVTFECEDCYATSLPVSDLLGDDVLLAYKLGDKPLSTERGGPLRLVVPKKYAYKSAKWIRKIKFTITQEIGFWEARGYSNTADPWKEERYA